MESENNNIKVVMTKSRPESPMMIDIKSFEEFRESELLYGHGTQIFEFKTNVVHGSDMPFGFTPNEYPQIIGNIGTVDFAILGEMEGVLINMEQQLKHYLDRISPTDIIPKITQELKVYGIETDNFTGGIHSMARMIFDLIGQRPKFKQLLFSSKFKNINTSSSNYQRLEFLASNPGIERNQLNSWREEFVRGMKAPNWTRAYFDSLEIGEVKEDIEILLLNPGITKYQIEQLRNCGATDLEGMEAMVHYGYDNWGDFSKSELWHQQISLSLSHQSGDFFRTDTAKWPEIHVKLALNVNERAFRKEIMEFLEKEGWEIDEIISAVALGMDNVQKRQEFKDILQVFAHEYHIDVNEGSLTKDLFQWARMNLEDFKNKKFSTPRSAELYEMIQSSPTGHLTLQSLYDKYESSTLPLLSNETWVSSGAEHTYQIHQLLQQPAFDAICVSNLEGGMVEKRAKDGIIVVEKEVEVVKIVEKIVEKEIKPLFNYSMYSNLASEDSRMNLKIRDSIDRRSLEDSLTASFTRFESNAKKLWKKTQSEPIPEGKGAAKKLMETVAAELKFTESMSKHLKFARILRNEEMHPGDEPSGLKLTQTHVKKVLDATEKIIGAL